MLSRARASSWRTRWISSPVVSPPVEDPGEAVAPLEREVELALGRAVEARAERDELADALHAFLGRQPRGLGVAQPVAGRERVLAVPGDGVPGPLRVEHRRHASLGVGRGRLVEAVLGEEQHLCPRLRRCGQGGRQTGDPASDDDDIREAVSDPGRVKGGEMAPAERPLGFGHGYRVFQYHTPGPGLPGPRRGRECVKTPSRPGKLLPEKHFRVSADKGGCGAESAFTAGTAVALRACGVLRQKTMPRHPRRRTPVSSRGEGIALLVVLVVFVILYLVVYQLHFSTTMEAKIAQVRYGEAESSSALHSVALYVMTLLVEDLKEDAGAGAGGSAAASTASEGGERPRAVGKEAGTAGPEGDGGSFTPLATSSGSSKWIDYLHENIFKDNRQQVGDITVKIRVVDGERAFDLNQLFGYPKLQGDAVDESGIANVTDDELRGAVEGKSGEAAALSLRDKVMEKSRQRRAAGTEKGGAAAKGAEGAAGVTAEGDPATGATAAASEYEVEEPFVMPEAERVEATRTMLERAIEGMFSINELNGFLFPSGIKYSASEIASSIIQYVLERRQQPYQNRIYLVTELLNIPGITPEVFYGPLPFVPEGEEFDVGNGFVLRRDDFGELIPEYLYGDVDPQLLEQENLRLQDLQSQLGQFADLAGFGFDPMKANPLTRGMSEQLIEMDQDGNEYVMEKPFPMGLRDLFTTWSSGKINLNTAPYPVIYGLLVSLSIDEANLVALDIRDYRNRFQEEVEEEGVDRVGGSVTGSDAKSAPDLGQPKRQKKDETGASSKDTAASSLDSLAGMDAAALDELSAYQDVETNYFTSLDQLELVDGTEGDASDRLRKDEGVERVDVEQDTLLRRVQNDLGGCVFGSTHFNAELRAKPKNGGAVKVGHLSLRRDTKKKMVEVLMWKNFQK